jgi:hypothetical protein
VDASASALRFETVELDEREHRAKRRQDLRMAQGKQGVTLQSADAPGVSSESLARSMRRFPK